MLNTRLEGFCELLHYCCAALHQQKWVISWLLQITCCLPKLQKSLSVACLISAELNGLWLRWLQESASTRSSWLTSKETEEAQMRLTCFGNRNKGRDLQICKACKKISTPPKLQLLLCEVCEQWIWSQCPGGAEEEECSWNSTSAEIQASVFTKRRREGGYG